MSKHGKAEERMMTKLNIKNILKRVLIMLAVVCALPVSASVGKVVYGYGEKHALGSDGERRTLIKGSEINEGDTLVTGRGRIHVRLIDGGFISVYPNSKYKIDVFKFSGTKFNSTAKKENRKEALRQESTEDRGFFSLLKGAARQITGLLGRTYNKNFKVKTSVATIGIRGTGFFARLCQADCFDDDGKPMPDGMYVKNNTGIITMQTSAGSVALAQGQSAFAASSEEEPQQIVQPPIAYNAVTPDLELYDFDEKIIDVRETDEVILNSGGGVSEPPVTTPANVVATNLMYVTSQDVGFASQVGEVNIGSGSDSIQQAGAEITQFQGVGVFIDGGILTFDKASAVLAESGMNSTLGVLWNRWTSGYTLTESGFDVNQNGTVAGKDIHLIGSDNLTSSLTGLTARGLVNYAGTGGTSPTMEGVAGSLTGTQTLNVNIDYATAEVVAFQLDINFSNAAISVNPLTTTFLNGVSGNQVGLAGSCTGAQCGANGGFVDGAATINLVGPNAEGIYGAYNLTNQENAVSGSYFVVDTSQNLVQ